MHGNNMNRMDTCRSFQIAQYAYKNMVQLSSTSPVLPIACTRYIWIQVIGEILAWMDQDGKRYFVVAGLRVQHEDKVMMVPFFTQVENKTGLIVSQEVFQLIDYIATCKQLQAFHGSRVLRILSDQGTEACQTARNTLGHITSSSTAKQQCS